VIRAAFEPRSNTSRTKVMQADFMHALALADYAYFGAVARANKLKTDERFDAQMVVHFLEGQGRGGYAASTNAELLARLKADVGAGGSQPQLVLFFSNGSFDGIIGQFAATGR
jgi:UDP-N-acetylmuramate: L-alanyl-gamma-D-glutamyl-meso-diaminopimelate ligase